MDFLIITGLSGAGKSQAANVLEDLDYYCVDNLPAALMTKFAELCIATGGRYEKVALVTDVRAKNSFDELLKTLDQLKEMNCNVRILYMDADVPTIVRRYKESRRPHPLAQRSPEGSRREIDITVEAFGFKYGIPLDADLMFDVRFLPNPFYLEELRPMTGLDRQVAEYVFRSVQTRTFMTKLADLLDFLVPLYVEEGKTSLTIAIGCTGGRHRSVCIASAVNEYLRAKGYKSVNVNRDIQK